MVRLKSNISTKIIGRSNLGEYGKKVNELAKIAEELVPDGGIYVSLVERGDVYSPINKSIRGLMDLEKIYSHRALQANPELSEEFAIIAQAMKDIDTVIGKRKQANKKFKSRKYEKKED